MKFQLADSQVILKPLLFFFAVFQQTLTFAENPSEIALFSKAEQANRVLWKRFIDPHGIMYDYVGPKGEVILPTPEECEKSIPNALGWWTPVENGGFFNGLYLLSQCMRYEYTRKPEDREHVKRLVQGLYKLQDVAETPGFLARGVGCDGRCHYHASSDDQNFPFILGLWRYLKTDIPTDQERTKCKERLVRHVEAIRTNHWLIIGDRPDFVRANWLHTDYHASVFMLATLRILFDLTHEEQWISLYREQISSKTQQGQSRRKSLEEGPSDLAHWSAWFYSTCQYAVRELHRMEHDPELKRIYAESMKKSAQNAVELIGLYKNYNPNEPGIFTPDWHCMIPPYREQANSEEAVQLAMEQIKVWSQACPAVAKEKGTLKPSICAAWIVVLSGDRTLIGRCYPEIEKAILHFNYDTMHYATFFFVENLVYDLKESYFGPCNK